MVCAPVAGDDRSFFLNASRVIDRFEFDSERRGRDQQLCRLPHAVRVPPPRFPFVLLRSFTLAALPTEPSVVVVSLDRLVDVKRVDYRRFFATSLASDTLPQAKRPPAGPPQLGRAKAPAGGFPPTGAGRGGQPPPPGQQQQQTTKPTTSSNAPTSWITL